MLDVIDFYAENPIENKIIASSNRFRTIENEDGYDLILTQTDPTKELKILGNDQPISIETNNNENIKIKNLFKSIDFNKTFANPNDTLEIKSNEYIQINGKEILLNATTNPISCTGERVEVYSTNSGSTYPVLTVGSSTTANDHGAILNRQIDAIELSMQQTNKFRFLSQNAQDYEFVILGTGKLKLSEISKVQITGGSNGQILTTDGSGNLSWTTPSSGGLTATNFVFNEIPTSTANPLIYNLANTPTVNTVQVFINGLLQKPTSDYTVSTNQITFVSAPLITDEILCHYIKP